MAVTKVTGEDIKDGSVKPADIDFSGASNPGSLAPTDIFYFSGAAFPSLLNKTTLSEIQSAAWAAQNANKMWAGPSSGSDAAPAFRVLVAADLPGVAVLNDAAATKVQTVVVLTQSAYTSLSPKVSSTLYVIVG